MASKKFERFDFVSKLTKKKRHRKYSEEYIQTVKKIENKANELVDNANDLLSDCDKIQNALTGVNENILDSDRVRLEKLLEEKMQELEKKSNEIQRVAKELILGKLTKVNE